MIHTYLPRLLVATALLVPLACDRGDSEARPGLPPVRAEGGADGPKIPKPPPRPDGLAAADKTALAASRYVATALPKHSAELGPRMSGTLTAVLVEEGERVKKGQLLFRLDTRTTKLGVAQAETALQGATIQRDNAQRELERQRKLAESGTISPAVLERAEATYSTTANAIAQAEVALSMARRNTSDSGVVSPIDGIVTSKLKTVGETVTMMPPTVVIEVQDQSTIELRARIPEAELKTIREGEHITAHFAALGVARDATIVRIQPTVDAQTRTIEIVADVANADNLLRPGMYVEVELAALAVQAAATAPTPAAAPAPESTTSLASATRKRPAGAKERP
jgi:RND family efflux transporter MFP subunit